jgi:hypothetical protein
MTREDLQATGQELYGEQWRHAMARAVLADYRLVRRWASGVVPIPADVERLLMALVERHRNTK